METYLDRTRLLLSNSDIEKIQKAKIAIFGLGGVGGSAAIALARSGFKHFLLVDKDVVSLSNINRQEVALLSTVGKSKCLVMKEKMLDINPDIEVEVKECFFLDNSSNEFNFAEYDYVIDAIDTVKGKISIIKAAKENNVPIISALGAGNKLDPTKLIVSDIYKTSVDPLAKVMRHELKKEGIKSLKVVYSIETPIEVKEVIKSEQGKVVPGSLTFVPNTMGLIIASEVSKDIIKNG